MLRLRSPRPVISKMKEGGYEPPFVKVRAWPVSPSGKGESHNLHVTDQVKIFDGRGSPVHTKWLIWRSCLVVCSEEKEASRKLLGAAAGYYFERIWAEATMLVYRAGDGFPASPTSGPGDDPVRKTWIGLNCTV